MIDDVLNPLEGGIKPPQVSRPPKRPAPDKKSTPPVPDGAAAIDQAEHQAEETKRKADEAKFIIRKTKIARGIRNEVLPEPDFVWAPRIPRDGVTLLVGEDGLGKSWLALKICMYLAAGKPLFNVPAKPARPIFYVHAEDRLPMLKRRIKTIVQCFTPEEEERFHENFEHFDVAGDDVLLLQSDKRGTLAPTKWVDSFMKSGPHFLTVFDPLARLHDAPENDSIAMTRCLKMLEIIGVAKRGGVLAPHHPNKSGTQQHRTDGTDSRGSGAIRASSRSQLRLIAMNEADRKRFGAANITDVDIEEQRVMILSQPKLSDGAKAKPILLRRDLHGDLSLLQIEVAADPRTRLLEWFSSANRNKPFTKNAAIKARAQWGPLFSEREAEKFIDEQARGGVLVLHGQVKGHDAYGPSPGTFERIAELDVSVHEVIEGDWLNIEAA